MCGSHWTQSFLDLLLGLKMDKNCVAASLSILFAELTRSSRFPYWKRSPVSHVGRCHETTRRAVRTDSAKSNTKGGICPHVPTPSHTHSRASCLRLSDDRTWPSRQAFAEGLRSLQKLHLYFPDERVFYQSSSGEGGEHSTAKRPCCQLASPRADVHRAAGRGLCRLLQPKTGRQWDQRANDIFLRKLNSLFTT